MRRPYNPSTNTPKNSTGKSFNDPSRLFPISISTLKLQLTLLKLERQNTEINLT